MKDRRSGFDRSRRSWARSIPEDKNRGLLFDPPMLAHCGRRFRVAGRLVKMIHEEAGRIVNLQSTDALYGVRCPAS